MSDAKVLLTLAYTTILGLAVLIAAAVGFSYLVGMWTFVPLLAVFPFWLLGVLWIVEKVLGRP